MKDDKIVQWAKHNVNVTYKLVNGLCGKVSCSNCGLEVKEYYEIIYDYGDYYDSNEKPENFSIYVCLNCIKKVENKNLDQNIKGFDVALFEERIEKAIKWNKGFGFNVVYDNYFENENIDFYVYFEDKKNMGLATSIESLDVLEENIKTELKKSLEKMILKCNKFLDELNKKNEKKSK